MLFRSGPLWPSQPLHPCPSRGCVPRACVRGAATPGRWKPDHQSSHGQTPTTCQALLPGRHADPCLIPVEAGTSPIARLRALRLREHSRDLNPGAPQTPRPPTPRPAPMESRAPRRRPLWAGDGGRSALGRGWLPPRQRLPGARQPLPAQAPVPASGLAVRAAASSGVAGDGFGLPGAPDTHAVPV